MRKALGLVALAFLVFFVVHSPDAAAAAVRHIGSGVLTLAQGLSNFFGKLAG